MARLLAIGALVIVATGRLGAMIDGERHCCRFLRFALTADQDRGSVTMEVTGPSGTADFLEAWIA